MEHLLQTLRCLSLEEGKDLIVGRWKMREGRESSFGEGKTKGWRRKNLNHLTDSLLRLSDYVNDGGNDHGYVLIMAKNRTLMKMEVLVY